MIVLAFYTMNFAHPGRLLGRDAMSAKDTTIGKPEQLEKGSSGSLTSVREVTAVAPNSYY